MITQSNIVCPVCGCGCDDLEVIIEGNKIIDVENACALGAAKMCNYGSHRNMKPLIKEDGTFIETSLDKALRKSARILHESSYPLLYGWSSTSVEAMKVGLELAEEVGGVIDNTSTICHGPSTIAVQTVGLPAATLGQVRHRADLIIYWGANPWSAHPRHIERYTALTEGRFQRAIWDRYISRLRTETIVKRRRRVADLVFKENRSILSPESEEKPKFPTVEGRKFVVVDVRKTRTAELADYFLQIEPGADYEILMALRALVRGDELDIEKVGGVSIETLEKLADMMIDCEFGAIFFGLGLTMSNGRDRNVEVAIELTQDLNARTKFVILPMRGHFNVTGADTVFTWQTGYPYAVDYSMGYPKYNPGETSAVDILRRKDSDAALVIASDPLSNFPKTSIRHLVSNPLIVIDPHMSLTATMADVVIPSAFVGIEADGTSYRMDHVPLPLRKIVEPPTGIMSDEEILKRLLKNIRDLKN